jgi:hypothetical protein
MALSMFVPLGVVIASIGSFFYFSDRSRKIALWSTWLGSLLTLFGVLMLVLVMNSAM